MRTTLTGIAIVALVSTLGDYIWYHYGVEHRAVAGTIHGAALLMAVGGVLGAASGRLATGLPLGASAGVGGALAYYALVPVLGQGAMVAAWATLWILLALLDGRLLRQRRSNVPVILTRGVTAAILGGLAFYLVVGIIWGRAPDGGRNYFVTFAAWAFAWAPGMLVLTAGAHPTD